jgi:hypothetical protein
MHRICTGNTLLVYLWTPLILENYTGWIYQTWPASSKDHTDALDVQVRILSFDQYL